MKKAIFLLVTGFVLFGCKSENGNKPSGENATIGVMVSDPNEEKEPVYLDRIKLPAGYAIDLYADGVINARSMSLSPGGTLFVGTRSRGDVYALVDSDNDRKADKKYRLDSGLNMPNGVAFKDGDLYVAEVNRILRYSDIENNLNNPPEPEVVFDQYPTEKHHGWKYIAFGPDGKLYVPVGAPCNICESEDEIFTSITRINADGTGLETVARGVRNTVGFTWHPETGELWFTDNGRDYFGEDTPACELNKVTSIGEHFGYPYCHQGDMLDDKFGNGKNCADYTPPIQNLMAHVAPLGCEFVFGERLFTDLSGSILIAEHGSWNRRAKSGYRITKVTLDENGNSTGYEPFATGWLNDETQEVWGRPVDLEFLPDGSMLVSDDAADAIYRIYYKG